MKKVIRLINLVAFVFLGCLTIVPPDADAIPAFSRDHKISCSFCHMGFQKLNSMGISFKQNGYRMPGSKGSYFWEKPIPLSFRLNFALPRYEKRDWNVISGLTNVPPVAADGATGESRTDVSEDSQLADVVRWDISPQRILLFSNSRKY